MCRPKWRCIFQNIGCTSRGQPQEDEQIESQDIVRHVRAAIEDRKGMNPVVMNVHGISSVTDYYVIASGNSAPHLNALEEEIETSLKREGAKLYRRSGTPASGWMVVDYVDVVVHLFTEEAREYYALEKLWADAEVVVEEVVSE